MLRATVFVLTCLLSPTLARGNVCEDAGHAAEQAAGLPADLLVAIGRVESGRRGPDGRLSPWPWSVNAAGTSHMLASASEAVALIRALQAQGITSVDVGCFQVNLGYHATAFTSLEEAFDPAANAQAAAAFLRSLRYSIDLEQAVGRYHSGDPVRGVPYMRQVMATWHGDDAVASPIAQSGTLVRVFVPDSSMPPWSGMHIVGEVRSGEAFDMLQAMNTGHDESMSTIHANTSRDAITRIENMVQMGNFGLPAKSIRQQIVGAVDLIVQVERQRDGCRRLMQLTEVCGLEGEVVILNDIFAFELTGENTDGRLHGTYKVSRARPSFHDRLANFGLDRVWSNTLEEAERS